MTNSTQLLAMKEVKQRLRVGQGTLYRLVKGDPDFKTVRIGGRRFMVEATLETWIRSRESAEA